MDLNIKYKTPQDNIGENLDGLWCGTDFTYNTEDVICERSTAKTLGIL